MVNSFSKIFVLQFETDSSAKTSDGVNANEHNIILRNGAYIKPHPAEQQSIQQYGLYIQHDHTCAIL